MNPRDTAIEALRYGDKVSVDGKGVYLYLRRNTNDPEHAIVYGTDDQLSFRYDRLAALRSEVPEVMTMDQVRAMLQYIIDFGGDTKSHRRSAANYIAAKHGITL